MSISLPPDIFRIILGHLDIHDILSIRQVCHELHELSKLRSIWISLLHKHAINQNIPIPGLNGKSIDSFSALELEKSLNRALKLRRNWVSSSPTIINQFTLEAIPNSRIVSMYVVPGHANRLLLSLSMHGPSRKFMLQCWDIGPPHPICLAKREFKHFRGMAVNKSSSEFGIVAILDPHTEILALDPQSTEPDTGFMTTIKVPEETNSIQLFHKSSLLTRDPNGGLHLWKIHNPQSSVELQSPIMHQISPPLDIIIKGGFILVLRPTTLEFYVLPNPIPSSSPSTLLPVFAYNWPWRIDNAVMKLRHSTPGSTARTPINIFLRFGSYFPWAINILHHYELRPNPVFMTAVPLGYGNFPYEFRPLLRETIGSPVRLHATSDMAIGDYGTAIWTDSHTEDYFNHADRGQRVAGQFSRYTVNEEEDEGIDLSDQVATAAATSVYTYQEEDSWVRIALDETEGRIFLGRDDGLISILEYV